MVAGALLLLWATFFARAVWTTDVFASRDMLQVSWPLRAFWRASILRGSWPGWFPGEAMGEPFTALGISSPFHPLGLLALVLEPGAALKWMSLLALLGALGGAYLLCRAAGASELGALFGAAAYGCSGYLVGTTSNQPYLLAAAALPWAMWGALLVRQEPRPRSHLFAVVGAALVLFGGDFQAYLVAVAGMCFLVLLGRGWRRRLPSAILLGVLCATAGCVQWLPGLLAAPGSMHLGRMTLARAELHSLHPLQLMDILLGPLFRGPFEEKLSVFVADELLVTGLHSLWVQSTYLGPLTLALAAVGLWRAPGRWFLGGAAVVILLLVLGRHTPLYGALFRWLPAWNAFRYPMKLFPFFVLLVAACASLGIAAVNGAAKDLHLLRRAWFAVALLSVLVLVLEWRTGAWTEALLRLATAAPPSGVAARLSANFISAAARVALVTLLGGVLMTGGVPSAMRAPALLLLLVADLFLANAPTAEVVSRDAVREPETAAAIRQASPQDVLLRPRLSTAVEQFVVHAAHPEDPAGEVVRARVTALENISQSLWGLESADMLLPLGSWWLWRLQQEKQWWVLTGHRLYGIGWLLASDAVVAAMGPLAPPVLARFPGDGLNLLSQKSLPRAYLARRSCFADDGAVWARLHAEFPVGHEAATTCVGRDGAPEPRGTVRALRWEPDLLELEVDSTGGELVVNDAWHRGWSATVDGGPVPVERVNLVVRGVQVPPGLHRVELRFSTPGLVLGGITSLCTLLALVGSAFARRRALSRVEQVVA